MEKFSKIYNMKNRGPAQVFAWNLWSAVRNLIMNLVGKQRAQSENYKFW